MEHLQIAASVKYYLYIVGFMIISYHRESICQTCDDFFSFCSSEVHSLLITFPKEIIIVKKVSNFKALFDTRAILTHMSRNKK